MELHEIIKKAVITEKSTNARSAANQYCFKVDRRANRIEIGRAVERLFKVKVLEVRVMNVPGKKKRTGRVIGERASWKKAVVTLAPGNAIETMENA